jgi:hypothetical protein
VVVVAEALGIGVLGAAEIVVGVIVIVLEFALPVS